MRPSTCCDIILGADENPTTYQAIVFTNDKTAKTKSSTVKNNEDDILRR